MLLPLFLCAVDYPSCFCGVASLNGTSSCASTDCDLCQTPQRKDLALASLTFIVKFEVRSHGVLLPACAFTLSCVLRGSQWSGDRQIHCNEGSDFDSESNLVLPTVGWCTNCRTI
ncbi:hypothetical protein BDV98DRAFT_656055 [Pterulicium gracile]|uniref:Secreted protein n=1 Tax=Pterulicium gracile TaxID=1884261 RepID=A0A5C3QIN1_9AGAR|nr:hypothetical protein BDV98DRAFT_656055 [Pterula gracilis]